MTRLPSSLTILVDAREQQPVLFPEYILCWPDRARNPEVVRLNVLGPQKPWKKADPSWPRLDAGDYAIQGYEHLCLMERKGSMSELQSNLFTKDFKRSSAAFERLSSACTYPYLVLDIPPASFLKKSTHVPQPDRVFDALSWTMHRYGLRLWMAGDCKKETPRRKLGEQLTRVMLAHILYDETGNQEEAIQNVIRRLDDADKETP